MSSTPFDRQTSFALYSAENPTAPQSGTTLDAEFNAVKVALDDTQQNLARIQDDDGVLKRGSVGRAQLNSSISLGFAAPALWRPSTAYAAEISTVFNASKFYICIVSHTSGPVFDVANWTVIADFTLAAIVDDGSITSAKLAAGAVSADKIGDGSISNSKLASGAVSTSKIADSAVTLAKLASTVPTSLANLIIPAGLGPLPWSISTLPDGWDWADGGVLLSDTAFPVLRAALIADGFPHGQDGSGNPKKPDARGSVIACVDDLGSGGAGRLSSASITGGALLGKRGGSETKQLVTANLPPYTPSGSVTNGAISVSDNNQGRAVAGDNNNNGGGGGVFSGMSSTHLSLSASQAASTFTGTAQGGTSTAFAIVQPTLVCKMIIKAH